MMLNMLRQLVDRQQFAQLKSTAWRYWKETFDVQALPLIALAHAQLGERQQALDGCARAESRLAELDPDARVDLAAVHCLLWRIDDAIGLLEPAARPDRPLAQARLAWCRMQQGRPDEARKLYRQAAERGPERLPVWGALVRLMLDADDKVAAQSALTTAIGQLERIHADLPEPVVAQFAAQFRTLQLEIWVANDALAEAEQWLEQRRAQLPEDDWVGLLIGHANHLAGRDRHAAAEDALSVGLKHFPHSLPLIAQRAELAQMQGRTMQSIQLLRSAIRQARLQDKPEVGYWVRLSGACLHTLDDEARRAADKAVELAAALVASDELPEALIQQHRLQAKNALAQVESQAQNFEAAETLFRAVLEQQPWFIPALQGLGQQQLQRGRIDEAVDLFERIRQIDPVKGYSSLINARRFPDDEETLNRIEQYARQPSPEGRLRSGLLLQLAAAWEKRRDYGKAFALATESNDASKKLLHYDPVEHRQRCARIRHGFSESLFEHRRGCGVDSSMPVFVLGMPRSGTTLIEQILAGHSRIFGAGELGVIASRVQGLNRWERHVGSGRTYPDCIDDVSPHVSRGIANGILGELKALAADKPGALHVIDKLPHNFEHIGFIKFLFPKARIISVRRDPRDIAISNYFTDYQAKHGGMGFAYDLTWLGEQLADHHLLMQHWHRLFPGEILEVSYEDVVEDTEAMARKMLDYIGVDWEPQVLAFNELERPVKTASVWQVRQPIYKTSTAKWLRYQDHLAPLILGTNGKIGWDPVEMVRLPEPGLLGDGVALYKADKLDLAEYAFKKLMHHLPEHAAAGFMLGLIYARKGHLKDAIELMEQGYARCPWNPNWRKDLIQAYEMTGETAKAEALKESARPGATGVAIGDDADAAWPDDFNETRTKAEQT